MTCRKSFKAAYPTQKAAQEGAEALQREGKQSGGHGGLSSNADPPGEEDVVKLRRLLRIKDEHHLEITDYTALPEIELPAGTIGVILDISELPDKPTGYLIEFADDLGRAIAWPHLPLEDFEVIERNRGRKGHID